MNVLGIAYASDLKAGNPSGTGLIALMNGRSMRCSFPPFQSFFVPTVSILYHLTSTLLQDG